ncbi:phage antirepressor [Bacteroidia bacterium]|nr:phage antirepressor [Bacteroidia bacterium]
MNKLQLFQNQQIRSVWNEEFEEWYFSLVDVIQALTDSVNPTDYLKKLRKRDTILGDYLGTNCPQIAMLTETGKFRKTLAATPKQLFRIVQSIPSKKAEPFKFWLAEVANDRLNEIQNPELTIDRAMLAYRALGYSEEWINARLQSIQFRKELTDQWRKAGVKEGMEYAILTNLMTKEWSGKTVAQYKSFKGLKKESLRDNMTNIELALNILAEASASEISKTKEPIGFNQSQGVALEGAQVAQQARRNIENRTGKSAISPLNAKELPDRIKNNILQEATQKTIDNVQFETFEP